MGRTETRFSAALALSVALHALLAVVVVYALYLSSYTQAVDGLLPFGTARWAARSATMDDGDWGERGGKGKSINSSLGDEDPQFQLGPQAQAFLSRDPVGPGPIPDVPTENLIVPMIEGGPGGSPGRAMPATLVPAGPPVAFGVGEVLPEARPALRRHLSAPEVIGVPSAAAPTTAPVELAEPADMPEVPLLASAQVLPPADAAPATPRGGAGVSSAPAADPAVQSDSESDPFSTAGTFVRVVNGRVEAQAGREMKFIRPRLTIKGQVDAATLKHPEVLLKLTVDATGKVRDVSLVRSSGSNEIDTPAMLAAWEAWVEPAKGRDGRPRPDVIFLTNAWR